MALKNHNNYHVQYYEKIKSREIITSRKIRETYRYFIDVLPNKKDSRWEYRDDLALHVIDFIEGYCRTSKGKAAPLKLELFQKAAISLMFGWVEKGTTIRKHRITNYIVARKNGKSTLASAIALYLLFADGESGPEIYAVATKRDQAKIIWEESAAMIRKSPKLRKLGKPKHSVIESTFNEGKFQPLGRDSQTLDGLNPSGATMDEIEAWTDMNMYDVIVDGTSARDNWFILLTSTAGPVRESVWDNLYEEGKDQINAYTDGREIDERMLYLIYELDDKEEWKNPKMWMKANPGLGTIKNYEDLERKVNNAKRKQGYVRNLVMKDFNVPETDSNAWLNLEDIINETRFEWDESKQAFKVTDFLRSGGNQEEVMKYIKPKYAVGGFDLSQTTDLTSASVMFKVPNDDRFFLIQMYWIPEDLFEERIEEDRVPYDVWRDRGLLRTCEGNQINYRDISEWFLEVQETYGLYMLHIGYDAWSAQYLVEEMKGNFGEETLERVDQGVRTLSAPMQMLGAELRSNKIVYDRNPLFEWCTTNVKALTDTNGNIKPDKRRNSRVRIDGFAATLNAYVVYDRNRENYEYSIR